MERIRILYTVFLISICVLTIATPSAAQIEDDMNGQVYEYPKIEPVHEATIGAWLVDTDGNKRAGEYQYLENSVSLGMNVIAYPFPHRFHLEFNANNEKDFLGDFSYAYKDIVMLRAVSRSLFHNLDNIELVDLDPANTNYFVTRLDASEDYGIQKGMSSVFLRLKKPDYPLHFFIDGRYVFFDGDMQHRFLGGSGWFNDINRVSQRRDVDQNVGTIVVGANSHLGPVEVEYSHGEKRFNVGGDKIMSYEYAASSMREGGIYPHHLIADTESSSNTIKAHTSYTGRLVASTTFSWSNTQNTDSNTEVNYFIGAGNVMWMPITGLQFNMRYKHKDADFDTPETLPANYLGYSSYAFEQTNIRQAMSSTSDTVNANVRYRYSRHLGFNLSYTYKDTDRDNNEEWGVTDSTTDNKGSLSVNARLPYSLKLKAKYEHVETDNPAYNINPDNSDSAVLSLVWTKFSRVSAFLSYRYYRDARDDVKYEGLLPDTEVNGRDSRRDSLVGSVTFLVNDKTSLTAGYAYLKNNIQQDLVYNSSSSPDEFVDGDAGYKDRAHSFSASLLYMPIKKLTINADVHYTISDGSISPSIAEGLEPISIGDLTEVKIKETELSLAGSYDVNKDWALGLKYIYNDFDNRLDNPDNPDIKDGTAQVVLITVSRSW